MKISVCIPTYNQGGYIEQTIQSVLAQEQLPDEIIISNDCSTDDTQQVLAALAQKFSLLKVINQPANLGMAENTNFVLRAASGEIVVKLDSDDMLLPGYIKCLYSLMEAYPKAGYAHGDVHEVNEKGEIVKDRRLYRKTGFVDANQALRASVKGYKVTANIIMFRKKALEDAGFIRNRINFAEDFYLSVNIADAGWGNAYYNGILACYRVWDDVGQARAKRKLVEVQGLTAVFEEALAPAFKKRNWDNGILRKARINFAINQSAGLGWKIFTDKEKDSIKEVILRLDDSPKTQHYIKSYMSGNKPSETIIQSLGISIKNMLKPIYKQLVK